MTECFLSNYLTVCNIADWKGRGDQSVCLMGFTYTDIAFIKTHTYITASQVGRFL